MKENILFLKIFLLASVLLSCNQSKKNRDLPNFIIIYADDLGYGDLSCYGASDIKTTNLDLMAKNGIMFTDFYSPAASCSPSRAGLLTGKYPPRTGINSVFFPESHTGLDPSEITLAEILKAQNYTTGIIGKWHLGHFKKFLPLAQGFDHYFGIPYSNDMKSVVYMRDNEVESYNVDQSLITKTYTDEAKKFIVESKEHPFFLFLSHNMPHVPIYASKEFQGKSNRGLYGDVIEELDWSVGEIILTLKSLHILENSLIIFTSDNGPWLSMKKIGGSAGILREGKSHTFEGGMRVPMIAMWPAKIDKGVISNSVSSQLDFLPTIKKILNMDLNGIEDGKDLFNEFFYNSNNQDQSFIYFNNGKAEAFRDGDWKIKLPFAGYTKTQSRLYAPPHDTLLFNLKLDPGEENNLLFKNRKKAYELLANLKEQLNLIKPFPKGLITTSRADKSHFKIIKSQ